MKSLLGFTALEDNQGKNILIATLEFCCEVWEVTTSKGNANLEVLGVGYFVLILIEG